MFKLVTFASLFAVAFGAGAQFPAGVDPAKCPNFPICDNAALHNQAPAAPQWQQPRQHWQPAPQQWNAPAPQWNAPAPQWNAPAPQWNAPAPAAPQWNHNQIPSEINGKGGDKYPSGVNPQACPNYPYCDSVILPAGGHQGHQTYRTAPLPGFTERLYPAGVSAASCPNYPEC